MNKKRGRLSKFKIFIYAVVVLILPSIVFAQERKATVGAQIPGCDVCQEACTFTEYVGCIYVFATQLAGLLAIAMIMYGGYKYITSAGNPDTLKEAKEIVVGAIVGLVLLVLAYLLLNEIKPGMVQ